MQMADIAMMQSLFIWCIIWRISNKLSSCTLCFNQMFFWTVQHLFGIVLRKTRFIHIVNCLSLHIISFQQSYNILNVQCTRCTHTVCMLRKLRCWAWQAHYILHMNRTTNADCANENQIKKMAMAIATTTNQHRHRP